MGVSQDTFNQYRGYAYEGQIANIQVAKIVSRVIEGAAAPFGRAVVRGSGERSCANVSGATVAADVIGISVRTMAVENNSSDQAEYAVGDVASVLRDGNIFAKCLGGASAGDTVHVVINVAGGEELGQLRGAQETTNTIELNQVKWVDDVADGEIGEIEINGILTA